MAQPTGWQSVRTVLEVIVAAGIIWMARSISEQNVSLAVIQGQIASLQTSVANVPGLSNTVAQMQVQIAEIDRRINRLESKR